MFKLSFIIALITIILTNVLSFQTIRMNNKVNGLSMIFGGLKAKTTSNKISIKVDGKVIESSEKTVNLRRILIDNNIEVYPLKAKVLGNCGGAGICGTCAVKVIEGKENFNDPSKNELKTLSEKGKASDIRLSCCSRISGPISIKTKP